LLKRPADCSVIGEIAMKRPLGFSIQTVAAAIVMAALAAAVHAQDTAPMTAAEHSAAADAYQTEAKQAQEKAAQHQLMLSRYKNAATSQKALVVPKAPMVNHCQKLVDSYGQVASEASELSKLHRAAATTAPGS
jgi:hypothetical protein